MSGLLGTLGIIWGTLRVLCMVIPETNDRRIEDQGDVYRIREDGRRLYRGDGFRPPRTRLEERDRKITWRPRLREPGAGRDN